MTPYMLSIEEEQGVRLNPREFDVTENGFLPVQRPLSRLSNSYYQQWEAIASNLPHLIEGDLIRKRVRELPVLSTAKLHLEEDWRRAYVVLAFLAHAFIWGGDRPAEVCPHISLKFDIL
jgi:indoleamine 2,3-dioxygenase